MVIADKIKQGIPLWEEQVMDCHMHMGPWGGFYMHENDAKGILKGMDAIGIQTACVAANPAIGAQMQAGNDLSMQACNDHPGRYVFYATLNPNCQPIIAELDRCLAHPACMGIKLHAELHGTFSDDERYAKVFERAQELHLPVLMHIWGMTNVESVERLAKKYPKAMLIMGHFGADLKAMEKAVALVKGNPNIYGDLALSNAYEGNVKWLCNQAGAHKVLLGTDMPWFDARPAVGRVGLADIPEGDKKLILGDNLRTILSRRLA